MEFKVGDKVRCIRESQLRLTINKIYTVLGMSGEFVKLFDDEKIGGWDTNRFKLITKRKKFYK